MQTLDAPKPKITKPRSADGLNQIERLLEHWRLNPTWGLSQRGRTTTDVLRIGDFHARLSEMRNKLKLHFVEVHRPGDTFTRYYLDQTKHEFVRNYNAPPHKWQWQVRDRVSLSIAPPQRLDNGKVQPALEILSTPQAHTPISGVQA